MGVRLVGVVGCRAGWVTASCDIADIEPPSLSEPNFLIVPTFGALLDGLQGQRALIAVDVQPGPHAPLAIVPHESVLISLQFAAGPDPFARVATRD